MGSRGQHRGLLDFDDPDESFILQKITQVIRKQLTTDMLHHPSCTDSALERAIPVKASTLLLRIGFQSLAECSLCALLEQLVAHLFVHYCGQEHIVLDGAAAFLLSN